MQKENVERVVNRSREQLKSGRLTHTAAVVEEQKKESRCYLVFFQREKMCSVRFSERKNKCVLRDLQKEHIVESTRIEPFSPRIM